LFIYLHMNPLLRITAVDTEGSFIMDKVET
jgi:hypothetical protein